MLVNNSIRKIIPKDIKLSTGSITSEIELWLELEYIQARVIQEYARIKVRGFSATAAHRILFKNPEHECLFRIKYAKYIDD